MMKKNIYQLLNEVETDFREYEQTELSSREKDYHKQKVLMEVRRMGNKENKNKKGRVWKAPVPSGQGTGAGKRRQGWRQHVR